MTILIYKKNSGFLALISSIIISIILLLIATNLSLTSFYSRSNILETELKKGSSSLAEACADTAILKLANNPSYTPPVGGDEVSIGAEKCKIVSILPATSPRNIKIQAIYPNNGYQKYYTNLNIVINTSNYSIIKWEETTY